MGGGRIRRIGCVVHSNCLVIVLPLDIKAAHRPTIQKVKEMDDTPWNNHWLRGWHGPEMDDHEILYKELVFIPLS